MDIRTALLSDMEEVFALRHEVFVCEQNVSPELELDGEDGRATHVIATQNGVTVGCARILFENGEGHVGRFAVRKDQRGKGIGRDICHFVIDLCKEKGCSRIWLNSQLHAVGFYEKLGFRRRGETFYDAGIEHIEMEI